MTSVDLLDWWRLGSELRAAALDHMDECCGALPHPKDAYGFLLENPECFDYANWPEGMPADPPLELVEAYFGGKA